MTKSREVQTVLAMQGEAGLRRLMIELFERMEAHEQDMTELGVIQLQMISQMGRVVDGAGHLRDEIEKIARRRTGDDDLPPASG